MFKILPVFLLFLVSCTQYEQQPELKDARFGQIQIKIGELEKESAAKKEECLKLLNEAEASKPQTGLKSKVLGQWKDCNLSKIKIEQELKYNQLLLETRRTEVADEYSNAIKSGKPWPENTSQQVPRGTSH